MEGGVEGVDRDVLGATDTGGKCGDGGTEHVDVGVAPRRGGERGDRMLRSIPSFRLAEYLTHPSPQSSRGAHLDDRRELIGGRRETEPDLVESSGGRHARVDQTPNVLDGRGQGDSELLPVGRAALMCARTVGE